MKRSNVLLAMLLCLAGTALAQQPNPKTAPTKPRVTAEKGPQPKFKAIFEPVNYKQDLTLFDVFFVSKEEGWVSGAANTVLHTKDGGNSWTAELGGDPQAQGEQLKHLFFTNARHGWAQAWSTMFRTTDGENWQQVTGDIRGNAFFVSDVKGFRDDTAGRMVVTQNGGTSWKEVFRCHAKMEVEGLTQERNCSTWVLQFPSARVGYALGDKRIVEKTEDGGATWKVLVGPEEPGDQRVWAAFFVDENTGYAARSGLFRTTDGGQTWQGVVAKLPGGNDTQLKFVDHEVGWSCLGSTLAYTVDGGKHWTSRELRFPTPVLAFSLPARDRGYVVGDHGMIYRYRVVPTDYAVKGMLDAPMMPEASSPPGENK
jgi:photosystem II stability/assembly factor-like uncharacterized protein